MEENLEISRRTADRWARLCSPSRTVLNGINFWTVTKSEDNDFYAGILDEHKGDQQIAFNCWVKKAVHAQFTKALMTIQKQLGLKNRAMVQGVIYAAKNVSAGASKRSHPSAHAGRNRGRRGVAVSKEELGVTNRFLAPTDIGEQAALKLCEQLLDSRHYDLLVNETGLVTTPDLEPLAVLFQKTPTTRAVRCCAANSPQGGSQKDCS